MNKKTTIIFLLIFHFFTGCGPKAIHKPDDSLNDTDTTTTCPFEVNAKNWFLYPPHGTMAGYPMSGISALQDARIRSAGYNRMFVKGKINSYNDEQYYNKIDSISFYFDSADTASPLNYRILDSMFICCPKHVYLISTDTLLNPPIDTSSHSPCNPPSISLPQSYQDQDNLYGKGISPLSYYNQASSWKSAEESAIKNLCRQSLIRISSMTKSITVNDKSNISYTSSIEMDIEVRNVQVVTRYYDKKSNNCIVWVLCRKSDVKPWKGDSN